MAIILLDTSAYAAWKRGDRAVEERVRNAERVFFSTVVAGELHFGFRSGSRFDRNLRELQEFLDSPFVTLLEVSLLTADRFGRIAAALRAKGTPIPTNDIWIAAHAIQSGSELLSYDDHFARIEGLVWSTPAQG